MTCADDLETLYKQIAQAISTTIGDRGYGHGDKLTSERQLAHEFGVSRPTLRDAIHAGLAQMFDGVLALAQLDALQQTRQKMAERRRELARRTDI